MLLTDIVVRNLTSPRRYTDDQTKGLHLWVRPDGKKYWGSNASPSRGGGTAWALGPTRMSAFAKPVRRPWRGNPPVFHCCEK
jgi:hypothetical protein